MWRFVKGFVVRTVYPKTEVGELVERTSDDSPPQNRPFPYVPRSDCKVRSPLCPILCPLRWITGDTSRKEDGV